MSTFVPPDEQEMKEASDVERAQREVEVCTPVCRTFVPSAGYKRECGTVCYATSGAAILHVRY
eukprot:2579675-Rhodomonas_salina.1